MKYAANGARLRVLHSFLAKVDGKAQPQLVADATRWKESECCGWSATQPRSISVTVDDRHHGPMAPGGSVYILFSYLASMTSPI